MQICGYKKGIGREEWIDGWINENTRVQEGTKRFPSPKTTSGLGDRCGAEQLLQQTQQFGVFSSVLFMLMAVCARIIKTCLCDILWRVKKLFTASLWGLATALTFNTVRHKTSCHCTSSRSQSQRQRQLQLENRSHAECSKPWIILFKFKINTWWRF